MIKVGITGQAGFVGRHTFNFLGTKEETIERISFERSFFKNQLQLENFVSSCDVIIHIAAMNRHENQQVIYDTNMALVNKIITASEKTNSNPKIIFASSTQEKENNLYGKSKRDGRLAFENWAEASEKRSLTTFIIPNVFGPFGKPFYNSFIATFCHQIIENDPPTIHQDAIVDLIYVNELVEIFYKEICETSRKGVKRVKVTHTSSKKVSEIIELLNKFKIDYVDNGVVPNLEDLFILNLFNTFTSFIPKTYFPRKFTEHIDNRGSFVEIMRANTSGQTSFSTTVPGITRGNHYHTRKVERFAVIKGKALIQLRKIDSEEVFNYELDGNEPSYVDMPIWYTHNIKNIGDAELITLFWINEPYNSEDSDTYFVEV